MSIFYKEIEEKDYEACVALVCDSFEPLLKELGISESLLPNFGAFFKWCDLKNELHQGVKFIGAFDTAHENRLVGCVGIQMTKDDRCKMTKLAVHPEYRHMGIGRSLMFEGELEGFSRGATKVELGLIHQNKVLEEWYEALGYKIGKVRSYKQSGYDITLMSKNISHIYQISQALNPHQRSLHEIQSVELEGLTPSKLLLIYHKNELYKNTNTGVFIQKSLPSHTEEWLWQRNEDQALSQFLKKKVLEGFIPLLVYPKEASVGGHEESSLVNSEESSLLPPKERGLFILLDCTWQEAKKIYNQSDLLRALPQISIDVDYDSIYNLRRNQKSYGLCTAETGYELMRSYMNEDNKKLFLDQMTLWLSCQN